MYLGDYTEELSLENAEGNDCKIYAVDFGKNLCLNFTKEIQAYSNLKGMCHFTTVDLSGFTKNDIPHPEEMKKEQERR